MKGLKRLFNKLFNRHDHGVNDVDIQISSVECNQENVDRTAVKLKCRLQRSVQESFREIFLMCMDPFI